MQDTCEQIENINLGGVNDSEVVGNRSYTAAIKNLVEKIATGKLRLSFVHPAAITPTLMMKRICSLWLGLSAIASLTVSLAAEAQSGPTVGPERGQNHRSKLLYGPEGVYAKIPARDEFGRDQLAMFRDWNPDPVGNHQANLRTIHPVLARVVRKTQADNSSLPFVIGSGLRGGKLQRRAVAWGWSRTEDSPHRSGLAVDLWPLDPDGHVFFDPTTQNRIAAAVKRAAAELGVSIRWGGRFHGFKDKDRSHFELRPDDKSGNPK